MLLSVVTVGAFAYVLSRIEKRSLVFGTICLALSSVLLLVPAAPYAGGLLPVNMAMLATRNIEYILYIVALIFFARSGRLRSFGMVLGVGLLALLIASDKIFLSLSGGGALLALVIYNLRNQWRLAALAVRWLLGTLAASILAFAGLLVLNDIHFTHIGGQSNPYALVSTASNVGLGAVYGFLGLLTNFGANPAFDATWIRAIPHDAIMRLISPSGPAYLINFAIFVVGLVYVWRLVRPGFGKKAVSATSLDEPMQLSVMLLWSGLVAMLSFLATIHYYAVDARYLTIVVFAAFTALAVVGRKKTWRPEQISCAGIILTIGIIFAAYGSITTYGDQKAALADMKERNITVAQILGQHRVDTLVGDYWRVLPAREASHSHINVTPLSNCTQARDVLSSTAWQPDLRHRKFAYLLSLDRSLTDYPSCTSKQVVAAYGFPNASVVVAGSLVHPKELLLFYDHGAQPQAGQGVTIPSIVAPIALADLPLTTCRTLTVMNVVAHQDDDLLFTNPDLLNSIHNGQCVRTVYVTAGDAGGNKFYWLSREQGSEAAYSRMLGVADSWVQQTVRLSDRGYATISSPIGNPDVSLIFMHLPDGNLRGQGFKASGYESLQKLQSGAIAQIRSVDGQSFYSYDQLEYAIADMMFVYKPNEVRTQATFVSDVAPDHNDHMAVSGLAQAAYELYSQQQGNGDSAVTLNRYIGYPIQTFPANVSGNDLAEKEAAFFAYAKYDRGVCSNAQKCERMSYGAYLDRQYTQ
jgi:LmbE family N-acetylglucosaminyl deacetylase